MNTWTPNRMKHIMIATLAVAGTAASAAGFDESAYFGRIDPAQAPRIEVTRTRALQANAGAVVSLKAGAAASPVYLHVRPEEERRWAAYCAAYAACGVPVLFVKESWYREVYLPAIGRDDGREQRYLDHVRFERSDRELRHRQDDE
jgi:hypothetical protein